MSWITQLRAHLPSRERMAGNPWLRWLTPFLNHPQLWRWSRRGVAIGVGLGVFFGVLVPIAQIPLAAATAVVLRANVPVAAASTLVSNPVTYAPIYYAAYNLGAWLTGEDIPRPPVTVEATVGDDETTVWQRIATLGMPLLVGMLSMATIAGLACYAAISLAWYGYLRFRLWRRRWPR